MVAFPDSMNWAVALDFDYSKPPDPGVILPSKKKKLRKNSSTKKNSRGSCAETDPATAATTATTIADAAAAAAVAAHLALPPGKAVGSFHPKAGSGRDSEKDRDRDRDRDRDSGSGGPGVSLFAAQRQRRQALSAAAAGGAKRIVLDRARPAPPLAPPLPARPAGGSGGSGGGGSGGATQERERQQSQSQSLPVSRRRRRLLALHARARALHPAAAMGPMRALLGFPAADGGGGDGGGDPSRDASSFSTHQLVGDVVAAGFCYLASNLQDQNENATSIFQEALALLGREQGNAGAGRCLAAAGLQTAQLQRAGIHLALVLSLPPALWLPALPAPADLAGAANLLVSRGDAAGALRLLGEAMSGEYYGRAPSRLLLVEAAAVALRLGRHAAATRYVRRLDEAFPAPELLQARVLQCEILVASGRPRAGLRALEGAMARVSNATTTATAAAAEADRGVEAIARAVDLPASSDTLFLPLTAAAVAGLRRSCGDPEPGAAPPPPLVLQPLVSLRGTLAYLATACGVSVTGQGQGQRRAEYAHLLLLAAAPAAPTPASAPAPAAAPGPGLGLGLQQQVSAALGLRHLCGGDAGAAAASLARLLEARPDDALVLGALARAEAMRLNFASAFDLFDHILLLPGQAHKANWFQREILYYWVAKLDAPLADVDARADVAEPVRRGWAAGSADHPPPPEASAGAAEDLVSAWKATALRNLQVSNGQKTSSVQSATGPIVGVSQGQGQGQGHDLLLNYSFAVWGGPGPAALSTASARLRAAAGLGAAHVACLLARHRDRHRGRGRGRGRPSGADGESGHPAQTVAGATPLGDAAAEQQRQEEGEEEGEVSFSDVLGVAMKWVQFADPLEAVVLGLEADCPGDGARLHVFEGAYEHRAFVRFREGVVASFEEAVSAAPARGVSVSAAQRREHLLLLRSAGSARELCAAAGVDCAPPGSASMPVSVAVAVPSVSRKGAALPGPGLFVQRDSGGSGSWGGGSGGGGYRLAHCSARSPAKQALFLAELEFVFDRLVAAISNSVHADEILPLALDLYFYWIHFSPLVSGNSEVGFVIVSGALLAAGEIVEHAATEGAEGAARGGEAHLEWEALLSRSAAEFRAAAAPLFARRAGAPETGTGTHRAAGPGGGAERLFSTLTPRIMLQLLRDAATEQ
jgi:hypothetical protein